MAFQEKAAYVLGPQVFEILSRKNAIRGLAGDFGHVPGRIGDPFDVIGESFGARRIELHSRMFAHWAVGFLNPVEVPGPSATYADKVLYSWWHFAERFSAKMVQEMANVRKR